MGAQSGVWHSSAAVSLLDYFCHLINCSVRAEKHLCSCVLCLCVCLSTLASNKPIFKLRLLISLICNGLTTLMFTQRKVICAVKKDITSSSSKQIYD